METCANPGCSEPGTNRCAGCHSTPYCGPTCQTAHWPTHKESCDGRLRKMGMDHLNKARGFEREHNWPQLLRYSDLAATKLKQLKDRPLEAISFALELKCTALDFLCRHREHLECAKEWYCLWNTKPTDVGAIDAALHLISSCINNNEFTDAHLYASTLYEIINHKHDNKIPDDRRQRYIAQGAYYLAHAKLGLAQVGGIPPEDKQNIGQEAIALARKALEIHTQLFGTDDEKVANAIGVLAELLGYFNEDDDEEVVRLFDQARAIHSRKFGSTSVSVAIGKGKLGMVFCHRARRANAGNDRDTELANLEMALTHLRETARIFRAIGLTDKADESTNVVISIEKQLQRQQRPTAENP